MKLNEIRNTKNLNDLKPAIRFLCDNMQKMSFGEFLAYKRTIESQCEKINISYKEINDLAEKYQIFGELL